MPDATVAPLLTEAQLARRVEELAQSIAAALPARFTLVGLLNGSFVFVADLARALTGPAARPGSRSCGSRATAAAPPARASSA